MLKKNSLGFFPLFLLFIPSIFLVNNACYYFGLLDWNLVFSPFIVYFLASLLLYVGLRFLFRDWNKSALITSFCLLLFYFFQPLIDFLQSMGAEALTRYRVILPLLLLTFTILVMLLFRTKKNLNSLFRALNIFTGLVLLAGLLQFCYLLSTHEERNNEQGDPLKVISSNYTPCDTCSKPDIYYILLDGYTNNKTLQKEFGTSIHPFEEELEHLGFRVITHSRSNYNFTHMSLSSVFNLQYLRNLDNTKPFSTKEFLQSYYTMEQNEWCRILQREGYAIKNYSIFDLEKNPAQVSPFLKELHYRSVHGQTFLQKVKRDIGWRWRKENAVRDVNDGDIEYAGTQVQRIAETFESVMKESRVTVKNPRFIYAHFLLPHETFYFDSTGRRLPLSYTINARLNMADYTSQIKYTNSFILRPLINSILKYNNRPAIIILQGDHGYRNYSTEKTALEFENFNAIYFPGKDKSAIPDSFTNVNTFRLLLNMYFGKRMELLPDSSFNLMKRRTVGPTDH